MSAQYKYDVTFSFLAQDEPLAERLHNLVSTTLKSFLYTKRQRELVGTDGEVTLNRVFVNEARLVVVLHRAGWGATPFTRIEQTAIQNRGFTNGYDFVLMIPLDQPPVPPPWMPKPRIWLNLGRLGESAAVAIIEERVREAGGEPQAETPEQLLARLGEDVRAEHERQAVLGSETGVNMARKEVESLFRELERVAAASRSTGFTVEAVQFPQGGLILVVRGGEVSAHISWANRHGNTLDDSGLFINYWGAPLRFRGVQVSTEQTQLGKTEYRFELTKGLQPGWCPAHSKDSISTDELAMGIVRSLSDHIRRRQKI